MPRNASKTLKQKKNTTRSTRVKPGKRVLRWDRILLLLGFLCLVLFVTHKYIYYRSLSLSRAQVNQIIATQPKALPLPTHIFIPWNTDVDIEPFALTNGTWQVSDTKASYLVGSALPGEGGNIVIYGHNKREIIGNIRALKLGDTIALTTADRRIRIYQVKSTIEVNPSQIGLLEPTNHEVLTLYTCSGLLDSQRFIVRAEPK